MQTVTVTVTADSDSGNRKFYVITSYIYISVQWKQTLIFYLYFRCLGAGRVRITWEEGAFCWGIIIKIFIGFKASILDERSLPGGTF